MNQIVEIIPPRARQNVKKPKHILRIIIWLIVVILIVASYVIIAFIRQTSKPIASNTTQNNVSKTATVAPQPSIDELNGLTSDQKNSNLKPLSVIIENSADARPVSGIGEADLVYEAAVEGGITRFLAVYSVPTYAVKIGPIRSARPYFIEIATELNAFFTHAGGSAQALSNLSKSNLNTIDGLSLGDPLFNRDLSRGLAYEHTLYSSTDLLWNYATTKQKWSNIATYSSWNFTQDTATSERTKNQDITINFSTADYLVNWHYDSTNNSYVRSVGGQLQIDANTNNPVTANNIIIQTVKRQPITVAGSQNTWNFSTIGTGDATILQNGKKITTYWIKSGSDRTRYFDSNNKEISFVPGKTWIEFVYPDTEIED